MMVKAARPKIPISTQVQVLFRDGWLCSLCGRPTIFPLAMKYADRFVKDKRYPLPIAYFDPRYRRDKAPLLDHLACVIDHVKAHSRGGDHDASNFAVACNKCNVRKSASEREQYLKKNPLRKVKGKYGQPECWDGLASLFVVLVRENPEGLTVNERHWLRELTAYATRAVAAG